MIYLIDNIQNYSENQYLSHLDALPEWRREKALRYKQFDDRKRCVLAFRLLEYALQNEYGITTVLEFVYNEYGKPYLPDLPIYFNLSHCKDAVACVVSDHEVGIDVESITPYNDGVARRICNAEEYQRLLVAADRDVAFTKLWTEKEAISKFCGSGVAMEFSTIRTDEYLLMYQTENTHMFTCCYGRIGDEIATPAISKIAPQ